MFKTPNSEFPAKCNYAQSVCTCINKLYDAEIDFLCSIVYAN